MKALMQNHLGEVLKLLLVLVMFMIVPHAAKAADFTNGSDMVSVNLAQGTFTLNGTNYTAANVQVAGGGADVYFKDAENNTILHWMARDDFFRSAVRVTVDVGGQPYDFVSYGPGSLGRFFDDLLGADLDAQQQDALRGALEAALVGEAGVMQSSLDSVLDGQTEEEFSEAGGVELAAQGDELFTEGPGVGGGLGAQQKGCDPKKSAADPQNQAQVGKSCPYDENTKLECGKRVLGAGKCGGIQYTNGYCIQCSGGFTNQTTWQCFDLLLC